MEVRHLELLRAIGERGSVAAAASALHVTPSAVSQQIRTAERELGEQLVSRVGRGVALTEAGRLLADCAVDVQASLAAVTDRWEQFRRTERRRVTLAVLPSAGEVILPYILPRLAGHDIDLRLTDDDRSEPDQPGLLDDHDLVLGHRMKPTPAHTWDGVTQIPLYREPLDIAVRSDHRLAGRDAITPADIAGERWVGVPRHFPFDDLRIAIEDDSGVPFDVVQRIRDNRLVESLVAAGMGIALLPRFSTRPRPEVRLVPLAGLRTGRQIVLLARPDVAARRAVREVIDAARDAGRVVSA